MTIISAGWQDSSGHEEKMKKIMLDNGWSWDDVKLNKTSDGMILLIAKRYL